HERWPLTDSLQLAHACARASLQAANAIDGAKTLTELQTFIQLQNN
ncbi:sugar kinase, partial [Klebsiella pneumoniae]|nr:sugar kinase [Klebsiella pneumoniae]